MSIQNKPDYKVFASDAKSGEIETFPDILRGWGVTIDRTGEIPPMEWFNAIGKRVDEWLMYLTQRGVAEWDSSLDYPKTAITQFNNVFYISTKATKGEQPDRSQASWVTLGLFLGLDKYSTTAAMNLELNKKFDKANISGVKGNDNDKVPSLNLLTGEIGKLQPKGDYLKVGDGGWMKDSGVSVDTGGKLSNYRLNSIGYAYSSLLTDAYMGTNHLFFNVFGYLNNRYGAQFAITPNANCDVGVRVIVDNVVGDWVSLAKKSYVDDLVKGLQPKGDYAQTSDLKLKLDISSVVDSTGTSTSKVINQGKVTEIVSEAKIAASNANTNANSRLSKGSNLSDLTNADDALRNIGLIGLKGRTVGGGENQLPDMSLFSLTIGGGGDRFIQKLPSGLIIQKTVTAPVSSGKVTANFPIVFPNQCLAVIPIENTSIGAVGAWGVDYTKLTASSVSLFSSSQSEKFAVIIAIGY